VAVRLSEKAVPDKEGARTGIEGAGDWNAV
jgi:hypothetical protein